MKKNSREYLFVLGLVIAQILLPKVASAINNPLYLAAGVRFAPADSIGDTIICADSGAGLSGVSVTLLNVATGTESVTQTDSDGVYLFSGLIAGDYIVTIDTTTLPETCNVLSLDPDGADDHSAAVALAADEDNLDQDFEYMALVAPVASTPTPLGSIGDSIICGETGDGLEGVNVILTDPAGGVILEETDEDGFYLFTELPANDYTVKVNTGTVPESCNIPIVDPDGGSDNSASVLLGAGENNLDQDFTYMPPSRGSIGDRVWCDANRNGQLDVNEGIGNASVTLLDNENVSIVTLTDNAGMYLFENLNAGPYMVTIDVNSLPAECDNPSIDPDNDFDNQSVVSLDQGENNLVQDFGYKSPPPVETPVATSLSSVGNYVWLDMNVDGIQDPSEVQGVAGITVRIHDAVTDTILFQTTTNSSGLYLFNDLQPGDYFISYMLPAGYMLSPQNTISNAQQDSDADPTSGQTETFTLAGGQADLTLDQGVFLPTTLSVIAEPQPVHVVLLPLLHMHSAAIK